MASYSFSEDAVQGAIDAGKQFGAARGFAATGTGLDLTQDTHIQLLAECISVTVENGEVCLDLPLGLGHLCLPIPVSIPSGTVAQACLSICTTWGIPTGVKVTVSALGNVIVEKSLGKC